MLPGPLFADNPWSTLALKPGETGHVTVNVSGYDSGYAGAFDFSFYTYDQADPSMWAIANATFNLLPPEPPHINYTFDSDTQGWAWSTWPGDEFTNLAVAVPSGENAPRLSVDMSNGSPNPGSLMLTVPFTAFGQFVDAIIQFDPPIDLSGETLRANFRLVSGSFIQGGLQLHASTGDGWVWGSGGWVNAYQVSSGYWVPLSFNLSTLANNPIDFDPKQVREIGIQLFPGFTNNGGVFDYTEPVVVEIDTVTD
jgi:hypothetical protein